MYKIIESLKQNIKSEEVIEKLLLLIQDECYKYYNITSYEEGFTNGYEQCMRDNNIKE